jgi:hypothetical protein
MNIFRVWIPHLSRVISTRDVTFNKTKRYQPSDTFDLVTKERVQPLEIKSLEGIEDKANIKLPTQTLNLGTGVPTKPPPEQLINTLDDTIIVDSRAGINHGCNLQLLLPEITPEPEPQEPRFSPPGLGNQESLPRDKSSTDLICTPLIMTKATKSTKSSNKRVPMTGTTKGIDEDLILPSNRQSQLCEAHAATLATLYYNSAYHAVFTTGITHQQRRLHQTELPAEPSNWQEILRHDH